MTAADQRKEHERIRAVYAYYESSDAEQRKRDTSIPGNRLNLMGKWAASPAGHHPAGYAGRCRYPRCGLRGGRRPAAHRGGIRPPPPVTARRRSRPWPDRTSAHACSRRLSCG